MHLKLFFCGALCVCVAAAGCFEPRRTEKYPPKIILDIVKPLHDKCVEQTGVSEDAIKQFSDGPVEEIDENNPELKCYMYCLLHSFENYEISHDFDELDFFTEDEIGILLEMEDKCESYEYNERHDEKCEYAFQLSKCWKVANPEYYFLL